MLSAIGLAFLLYFRLIARLGPTRALTVTFLMPAFGMFFGVWILHEALTASMIAGCALIICGVFLVLKSPDKKAAVLDMAS